MDNIIIEKVINNNIISAYEKSGAEVIVMGRGIGFKKKQGEVVPADQISKINFSGKLFWEYQVPSVLHTAPIPMIGSLSFVLFHCF